MNRVATLIAAGFLICAAAWAQSASPGAAGKPGAAPALPRDSHDGITILADAYSDPSRAKEKFGKASPVNAGILPLEVFLRNDSDHAVRINLSTIQLEIHFQDGGRQDINWLRPAEAAYLIAHPAGPSNPRSPRMPVPSFPGSGGDKKSAKVEEILRPLALDGDIVPPMSTLHGFLYFDLSNDMSLARDAVLYVPDAAAIPGNKTLIFFEVPLGKPAEK